MQSTLQGKLSWLRIGVAIAVFAVSCFTRGRADSGSAPERFYLAGSTLEVLSLEIGGRGVGELRQAYVSPGFVEIYVAALKLTRIRSQGDTEVFDVHLRGKGCSPLILKKTRVRNIVLASMEPLTQAFSAASKDDI